MPDTLDDDGAALARIEASRAKRNEPKKKARTIPEVDADLNIQWRLRMLGKARGENRTTTALDQSKLDLLLAERHYLVGE